jgi:ketosteroid isomerase-like protein
MNRFVLSVLLLLFTLSASSLCAAAQTDHPEIRAVIETFRTAIIQRDKPRFLNLFVKPDLPWQSVLSDKGLAQVKVDHPEAIKAKFKPDNNPTDFIDSIVKSEHPSEETFSNIRIDADNDVATVTFDYAFLSDGRSTNWGKECWLLVRTEDGWKITTLAYSITLTKEDK